MRSWQSTKARCAISPRWLTLGLLILLCADITQARIGENEAQVKGRYGDPVIVMPPGKDPGLTKCYVSGVYSIAVTYADGRSVREILTKSDKSQITTKEIHNLLEANAGGSFWMAQELSGQKSVPTGFMEWRTNNQRSRVAFYDTREQAFFVTTQRFIDLTNNTKRSPITHYDRGLINRGTDLRLIRDFNRSSMMRGHQAEPSPSPPGK